MMQELWTTICLYVDFYRHYATQRWSSITPTEYGILLIGVGIFGWVLLKSVDRK